MSVYHFSDFELDASRFELRRKGHVLKLERIPMELLILLVEKDGGVTTRQEIVDRLWGKDVFVDTEHGINTAIHKIRQTLRDDPEKPQFVQTVTGKGYRFVAERKNNGQAPPTQDAQVPRPNQEHKIEAAEFVEKHKRSRRTLVVAGLAVAAVVAIAGMIGLHARRSPGPQAEQIRSIAVIPLVNLSGDKSQDYFADGMTDELITALAKNRNLRIVSRTSAMQYKGVNRPVKDIARELNVDGILEGSVEHSTDHVHMTVQLIYAPTDTHIWAESYDRDAAHAISIPTELSRAVAEQIKMAVSPAKTARPINSEAYDAYLRGRYFWLNFDTKESIAFFQKAIDLQPDYAAAWSGISDSYAFATLDDSVPAGPVLEKAKAAAHKALELDDSSAEAHASMAGAAFLSWNIALSDTEILRALELAPQRAESHYLHYHILLVEGRNDAALAEVKLATQLDPFSRPWGLGSAYMNFRQFDDAMNEFRLQAKARPTDATIHFYLSQVYWFKGRYSESEEELEKSCQLSGNSKDAATFRRFFQHGGEEAVARYAADRAKARARKSYLSPLTVAEAVSYTGKKDETLKYLEAAYEERVPSLAWIDTDIHYDFLHSDPRYQALVRKMGLTPVD